MTTVFSNQTAMNIPKEERDTSMVSTIQWKVYLWVIIIQIEVKAPHSSKDTDSAKGISPNPIMKLRKMN